MPKPKSALMLHLEKKVNLAQEQYGKISGGEHTYLSRDEGKVLVSGVLGAYKDMRDLLELVERRVEEWRRRMQELADRRQHLA